MRHQARTVRSMAYHLLGVAEMLDSTASQVDTLPNDLLEEGAAAMGCDIADVVDTLRVIADDLKDEPASRPPGENPS